jgi:oxygen-independent coproporphyrinogen-3 oxidase
MDPGTFDRAKLKSLWNIGFNRLSVGIQSFDELILQKCGRAHNSLDVQSAVQSLQSSDFRDNFSIDLIGSLPYLTPELWRATLLKAVDSGAAHISVYDLQVEGRR